MSATVEVFNKNGIFDAIGESAKKGMRDFGIKDIRRVRFVSIYRIYGNVSAHDIDTIARELLIDRITQSYSIDMPRKASQDCRVLEIAYNPGVMDPVEESAMKAVKDLGIKGVGRIRTAKKYIIEGGLPEKKLRFIAEKLLYNKTIEHIVTDPSSEMDIKAPEYEFKPVEVKLLGKGAKELAGISKHGQLFLNIEEMRRIQSYFSRLKRNPVDVELEAIAQTWSEHCKHKTLRGKIEYEGKAIDNLLKQTIMKVTKELNKDWCVSVFAGNSGVINFDKKYNISFKVETHNHPSAIEPYGGAGTGIGGVIRDTLGTGLGATPIINTDIFCFGPPDYPLEKLPKGTLHPRRVMKGVVSGVRDYGNRMGIPTANGAVLFDERYIGNPLVYCGNVGLIPKKDMSTSKKNMPLNEAHTGDLALLVGGKTGRDGIHGATFSSGELHTGSEQISNQAVQIGNPITEKKMADAIINARKKKLFRVINDCGAGGLSGAVGEMGQGTGVEVYLDKVPLKYEGLSYREIWISEAQERMVMAVPAENLGRIKEIFELEDVDATVIGKFTFDKKLKLFYKGQQVARLDMDFLHEGLPDLKRKAVWRRPAHKDMDFPCPRSLTAQLIRILSSWNVCSKEWIIRQYDHEVQGGSVLKPLQGIANDGPGDGCVFRPVLGSKKGVILSCGINYRYGLIDPYWMAASCIDEALRQVISCGGDLSRVALLDNFCWGNTEKPEVLGGLVRAAVGCYDFAKAYAVPFISGKDSLNNEYNAGNRTISIPPTLLISAIAVMDDVNLALTMDAKEAGDLIYVVGMTKDELGGSHYLMINGLVGNNVPTVDAARSRAAMAALVKANKMGLIRAIHDCSEGGIAVAAAETAFSGGLGMQISVPDIPAHMMTRRNDTILFSESNSRFVVEVKKSHKKIFEALFNGLDCGCVGSLTAKKDFIVTGLGGKKVIEAGIGRLKKAWQKPFSGW